MKLLKNGIYIRKLESARMGDLIKIPKFATGDPSDPDAKHLNCDWIAVSFMEGIRYKNSLPDYKQAQIGEPEQYHFDKLLKFSKSPKTGIFLVNEFIGSDPISEFNKFEKRFDSLTLTSAFRGVIVRVTADFANRTVNAAKEYMTRLVAKNIPGHIILWLDSSIPLPMLKEFLKYSENVMYDVYWNASTTPSKSVVTAYLAWKSLGVINPIPVLHLQNHGLPSYTFQKVLVNEAYDRLMHTDDVPGIMWYYWDAPDGLENEMAPREVLFRNKWTAPYIEDAGNSEPPVVIPEEPPVDPEGDAAVWRARAETAENKLDQIKVTVSALMDILTK